MTPIEAVRVLHAALDEIMEINARPEVDKIIFAARDATFEFAAASPVQGAASSDPIRAFHCTYPNCGCIGGGLFKPCVNSGEYRAATSSASGAKGAAVKPWQERLPDAVRQLGTAASEAPYKDAEIADWRALADRSPAVQPSGAVPDIGVLQEQSAAWFAVCAALTELRPRWQKKAHRGLDAAVATIRSLATPAPEQEAAQVAPPGAQEVHQASRATASVRCWRDIDADTFAELKDHTDYVLRTLYTAPVPATTPAEQVAKAVAWRRATKHNWEYRNTAPTASTQGEGWMPLFDAPPVESHVMRRFGAPASQYSAPGGALHDALMRCCLELPAGYEVRVCVERDSGWVEFADANGDTRHIEGEGHLSDDVVEALEAVQAEASASPVPRAQGGITNNDSSGKGCATATNTNQPEGEKGGAA